MRRKIAARKPDNKTRSFYETVEMRGRKYIKASPAFIRTGTLVGEQVVFSDVVNGKPRLITRRKHPLMGPPEQEFYTIIKTHSGITVGYPGIALLEPDENATFYGIQTEKDQVVADVIEGEKMVYEIQD